MNQLFFDIDSKPEFVVEENINESTGRIEKTYKVKGIFSTIGEKNRNGRVYPRELWESEVQKYQQNFTDGSINCLMEWEHPARTNVDPMKAVGKINSLKIDGKYVIGEAVLLNNEQANQLKSLIDNGVKISVSSRGTGSVHNGVVSDFNLITYDFVPNPSDFNATMNGMCESHQLNEGVVQDLYFMIDKNGNIVPADGSLNESKEPEEQTQDIHETQVQEVNENEASDGLSLYTSDDISKAIERKFVDILESLSSETDSTFDLAKELSEKVKDNSIVIEDPYNFEIRYLINNGALNESNYNKVDFKRIANSLKKFEQFDSLDNVKYIKMENYKVTEVK